MGHAYVAAEGCDEVLLLGVCSSADEHLMESLLTLHGEEGAAQQSKPRRLTTPAGRPAKAAKGAKPAKAARSRTAQKATSKK
jgi:hypothetical protein